MENGKKGKKFEEKFKKSFEDNNFIEKELHEDDKGNKRKRKVDNKKKNNSIIEINKLQTNKSLNNNFTNPFIPQSSPNILKSESPLNINENSQNLNESKNFSLNDSDLNLIFEDSIKNGVNTTEETIRPNISKIYYINGDKLTVNDLKDGRRIFNNKTEFSEYKGFKENFLEFRQLLFENLLLYEDFTENLKEKWTMESAIFSTFCYDPEFIEPLIKKFNIKSLIIKEAGNFTNGKSVEEQEENITFIHPKLDYSMKWGKFHSKLTIFKFPDFIRVIIPSANLTSGDWYYWGQIIWFQDFYKKNKTNANCIRDSTQKSDSDFEFYLGKVFESVLPRGYTESKWFKNLNIKIDEYDFSFTCVDLVASASGRYNGENRNDYGVGRLRCLTESYSKSRSSLKNSLNKLTVQCSSIGRSLKDKFLSDLCEGLLCRKKSGRYNIDIIYPTVDYVESFQMGRELSSCLFLNQDTYQANKEKFKKFEVIPEHEASKTIFHSKFFISSDNTEKASDNMIFYFGSHNFSIAAWGSFEKNDSQLSIANYELGIVFNPIKLKFEEKEKILKSLLINLNSSNYSNLDEAWIFDSL